MVRRYLLGSLDRVRDHGRCEQAACVGVIDRYGLALRNVLHPWNDTVFFLP